MTTANLKPITQIGGPVASPQIMLMARAFLDAAPGAAVTVGADDWAIVPYAQNYLPAGPSPAGIQSILDISGARSDAPAGLSICSNLPLAAGDVLTVDPVGVAAGMTAVFIGPDALQRWQFSISNGPGPGFPNTCVRGTWKGIPLLVLVEQLAPPPA